ncbi:MAG: Rrf2 family transcriptional regulator [Desulfobacterales bacterium]|nr:Rrf2 family transcriptional regulator [Desulfobacterales bacterium]MBU8911571.1 Rrf2 family transcriptional regulator [Desulfobacterales bacterium]
MRLTTKSRYGTRLILDIAVYGKEKPVPLSEVSSRQNISSKYLEQLTGKLKKAGIIKSHRGPFGGHMLAKSPDEITIGSIVRILEESTAITDCAEKENQVCGVCNRAGECLSQWVWVEASRAMFDRLDKITISGLLAIGKEKFKKD